MKLLIEFVRERKGQDVATTYLNTVNEDGASALHYAAEVSKSEVEHPLEDQEVVKLLLENGADSSLMTTKVRKFLADVQSRRSYFSLLPFFLVQNL